MLGNVPRSAAKMKSTPLGALLVAGEEPNPEQDALLDRRGEAIYRRHAAELERKHHGKVAGIEIESEKIYIGVDLGEAAHKAMAAHPGRVFYFRVIGIVKRSRLRGSRR